MIALVEAGAWRGGAEGPLAGPRAQAPRARQPDLFLRGRAADLAGRRRARRWLAHSPRWRQARSRGPMPRPLPRARSPGLLRVRARGARAGPVLAAAGRAHAQRSRRQGALPSPAACGPLARPRATSCSRAGSSSSAWAGHPLSGLAAACLADLRKLPKPSGSDPDPEDAMRRADALLDANRNGPALLELAPLVAKVALARQGRGALLPGPLRARPRPPSRAAAREGHGGPAARRRALRGSPPCG